MQRINSELKIVVSKNDKSIPTKDITSINLFFYIIQKNIIPISYDHMTHLFESDEVVHHNTTKERNSILQRRFIDDNRHTFRFVYFITP